MAHSFIGLHKPLCHEKGEGVAEDETVRYHHRLHGHEFEQTPEGSEGQRSLVCCSPRGRNESDMTEHTQTHI